MYLIKDFSLFVEINVNFFNKNSLKMYVILNYL